MPGFEGIEANPPAPPIGSAAAVPFDETLDCPAAAGCLHNCKSTCYLQDLANAALEEHIKEGHRMVAEYAARPRVRSVPGRCELLEPVDKTVTPEFRVYVGGPIDFVGDEHRDWQQWRARLVRELRSDGFEVFAAHEGTQRHEQAEDHAVAMEYALRHADAMVAFLPPGVVTYGTPIEVYRARDFDIPVMVVGCSEKSEPNRHGGSVTLNRLGVEYADSIDSPVEWLDRLRAQQQVEQQPTAASILTTPPLTNLPFVMEEERAWALPHRHYSDDAGLDLYVTETTTVRPGEFADVPAGCRTALPVGTFGLVVGRSSTIRKRGVLVVPGVIDVGWRGPLFVGAYNAGNRSQTIRLGDRIGQLLILPNLTAEFQPVQASELSAHARGEHGFGSTGGVTTPGDPDNDHTPEA